MRIEFSERRVHGVLCLHARGLATRAGSTAQAGFERPGSSWPRRTDRGFGKRSRRTASTGSGFGLQSESCFCELPEWAAESVDRRTTFGFTRFRAGRENASVLKDPHCLDGGIDRCGGGGFHRDARFDREWLPGQGWGQSTTGRRVIMCSSSRVLTVHQ